MCSVLADTESHRFFLATNSYKKPNEVHLISYSEDSNRIDQEAVYSLDASTNEVWSISASPYNRDVFACGVHHSDTGAHSLQIYDMSEVREPSKDLDKKALKSKLELGGHSKAIHSIVWEDSEASEGISAPKEIISGDSERVSVWDLQSAQIKTEIRAS